MQTAAPRIGETSTTVKGHTYTRFILDLGRVDGRRKRQTFSTREAAESALEKHTSLAGEIGKAARRLKRANLEDAAKALAVLDGAATLATAATFWMKHNRPDGPKRTVAELVDDYVESRRHADRREQTIADLRHRLNRFAYTPAEHDEPRKPSAMGATQVAHVTTETLERWMERHVHTPGERYKMRIRLVGLFNHAKARRLITDNPASAIRAAKPKKSRPYVMPVSDIQKLLTVAQAEAPEMVPYFALCLFAGIRPHEARRLDWQHINLDRREIYIDASISKTHDERFVEIADNLGRWLFAHRKAAGPVPYIRKREELVRRTSEVRWAHDCMRHSFGSYHLAAFENAGKTALQMGHRSLGMLFEHYRRAVRKEDADAFWRIAPSSEPAERVVSAAG